MNPSTTAHNRDMPEDAADELFAQVEPHLVLQLDLPAGANPPPRLQQRLLQRARASAAEREGVHTVRHGDTPWSDWRDGARTRELHATAATRAFMLELKAGAMLPWREASSAQEWLVLRGGLAGGPATSPPVELHEQGFALCRREHGRQWRALADALLYVRELCGDPARLPAAEAAWWRDAAARPVIVPPGDAGWLPFADGVRIKPLCGADAAISMLARFERGASVLPHGHALDEDCVMLSGDLFLGDVLLREGEYQLARAGTRHNGLMSDTGAVLFFHGAVDTSVRTAP